MNELSVNYIKSEPKRGFQIKIIVSYLFLFFCLFPFLFPNPILTTDVQPYAAVFAVVVLFLNYNIPINYNKKIFYIVVPIFTFIVGIAVLIFNKVDMGAFRGLYNYFALMVIPFAVVIALNNLGSFPEKFIKAVIIIWFLVASIQFFVYRGFAAQLISGARWSDSYRGVLGLASEPSFLGIVCFYFLHLIIKFKKKKYLYMILVLITGTIYAQSAMGVIFILGFMIVFLLNATGSKNGVLIWLFSIIGLAIAMYFFTTKMTESRLYSLYEDFMNDGVDSVLEDGSVETRYAAIENAFKMTFDNYLLPYGFNERIGSAFGGMLIELGFFAIPAIIYICRGLSITFEKKLSIFLYFILAFLLFTNNTQIGNPLLLMVIGVNIWFRNNKNNCFNVNRV